MALLSPRFYFLSFCTALMAHAPLHAQENIADATLIINNQKATSATEALVAQSENPLKFSRSYAAVSASFTLPQDVLIKQGRVIVLNPELKERKTQFLNALGSIDEAVLNITGVQAPARDMFGNSAGGETEKAEVDIQANNPMLPPNSREFPFVELRDYLQQGIITAPDALTRSNLRTDLARLHITFSRYSEALGILSNFPKDTKTNLPKNDDVRILMGIASALEGNAASAEKLLRPEGDPEDHRLLWLAYVTDNIDESRRLFTRSAYLIPGYPPEHDELLTRAYAQTLINTPTRTPEIIPLIEDLATRLNGQDLQSETLYLLSKTYELSGDENMALRILANVAESGNNKTAYRAKYDFITKLQRQGNLSNKATIQALESLSRLWRGDELEQEILLDLGRLYLAEKDFRKALNYLKDYVRYFPTGKEREQVAYLMTQNFLSAFNNTNILMTDDLKFLSLYYDFRELTPADKRGDRLIQDVAERLERLNLFDQAQDLFEQQLSFRTEDENDKIDITLDLARLHRKNHHAEKSLSLLQALNTTGLNNRRQNDIMLEMAKAHYALDAYETSKKLLQNLGTDGARDMLIEIAWKEQDSATLIRLITPIFETGEHAGFETAQVRNHFIKMAYAYAHQEDIAAIKKMKHDHPNAIQDYPEISDAIAFAIARSGAEDVVASISRPVGRLSKEIASLNKLLNEYDVISSTVQERKKAREIFNKKMRYMERRGGF